jgi:SAM-dependent methyltransferase
VLEWLPIAVCVGLLLNGIRLRGRLRRLDTVPASGRPPADTHEFLVAGGVRLTAAARRAASNHASRERLDVLDLIPADLTVERALDVARMVDTRTYRGDRSALGRGAFQALLVRSEVLRRAGIRAGDGFDPVDLVDITERLKLYAPATTDLAVLPGLRAARDDGAKRVRVQKRAYRFAPQNLVFPTVRDIALAIGWNVNRPWGIAALVLFWFQPFFVCAGRVPMQPRDLIRSPVVRITAGIEFAVSSIRAGRRRARTAAEAKAAGLPPDPVKAAAEEAAAERRERYQAEIRAGVDRFLEPERADCPWCGSYRLAVRLTSADLLLRKPGRFRLDECGNCGHIFANPRPTPGGLDFYYRDCYDGVNADQAEAVFAAMMPGNRARAELIRPFTAPRAWLDVGTGYGHFCNAARDIWPQTAFDGLDMTDGIDEARRRGWVDHGYRGSFPDLVDQVAGRYDVISMFHYLEHTRDPSAELDAAVKALPSGGHLFIELPNAHGPSARIFGRFWIGWFVPQHQHLIPAENLLAALEDRGMRIVLVQFGRAHQAGDAITATHLLMQLLQPKPSLPWLPYRATPGRRLLRILTVAAALPLALFAGVWDFVTRPYFHGRQRANAYRIIARRED